MLQVSEGQGSHEGIRRYPRREFSRDVFVMDDDGFGFFLEAENVSRGGVFLRSSILLEEGQPYHVRLELEDGRAINAVAQICRTHASPHTRHSSGMALRFVEMDELSREVLESVTPRERNHVAS